MMLDRTETGERTLFQCEQGEFEGELAGAMHHAEITGHTLTKTKADGTVITVSLDLGEDDQWP